MKRQQYRRGYLRGLGLGVVITALIFCITSDESGTLSDAEIRARALELGMVDGSSLTLADVKDAQQGNASDKANEAIEPSVESNAVGNGENAQTSQTGNGSTDATQEQTDGSNSSQETTVSGENTQSTTESETMPSETGTESTQQESTVNEDAEVKTITITSGTGSYNACVQLEEAGLIEDAWAFDRYLINIGYSRYVNTGTYKIKVGTSEEEIAKIITRKQ